MPYDPEEPEDHDPFDYDYEGPNSTNHGFGGYGFDDMNPDDNPEFFPQDEPFIPTKPERSLAQIRDEEPALWEQLNRCVFFFSGNRHKRMLKMKGSSAGWEKHMLAMEEDIDAGYLKLENAHVQISEEEVVFRLCLFEFDSYENKYELSIDSISA